jgi:hypothetical protein
MSKWRMFEPMSKVNENILLPHSNYFDSDFDFDSLVKFPLAPMGVLAPCLRTLDGPLVPHRHERKPYDNPFCGFE